MTDDPILELHRLGRVHRDGESTSVALADVDLELHSGELVAVMGRSGSGKSTLLNLAGGLDEPTSGTVTLAGNVLSGMSRTQLATLRRRHLGFVFQDLNLLPTLTAVENVALPLELDGKGAAAARTEALEALETVDAGEFATRFPDQLSGGQRQRVAIARAFVGERRLLLADEPTGALDELSGQEILKVIRGRCDAGAACLLVTHEAGLASMADRVVRLRDGRIEQITERSDPEDVLVRAAR